MKTKIILILTIACLFSILFGFTKYIIKLRQENHRLENNQTALFSEMERYKTESGKNAAKVLELELSNGEFKRLCDDQVKIIEDMGVKIKRLTMASSSGVSTNTGGKTELKDTVFKYLLDTIYIEKKVKHFEWSDAWNKIEGTIDGKEVDCRYQGTDTLTIAAVRIPKKFLFFRWGCKYIEVNIANQNPSSQVTWNRTIKFKR